MVDTKDPNLNNEILEKAPESSPASESGVSDKFSPVESNDDDFGSSIPSVSINKKKNIVLFVIVCLVFMYFAHTFLSSKKPKPVARTESTEMLAENRQKSKVPAGDSGALKTMDNVSPGSALPGSVADAVPVLQNVEKRSAQGSVQETLPPPPTLPPVFDPASIYVKDDQASDSGVAPSLSSPPAAMGAFGEKYTKKRSRLPEVNGGDANGQSDVSDLDPETQKALDAERKKKINANMFVMGSGAIRASNTDKTTDTDDENTESTFNSADSSFKLSESASGKQLVTVRKDLERVILQGKVMDAVLETAINTDLPGKLRGIVSRDVYSESGKRVVIPKGSRLIGSYGTDIKFGQARVYVIWNRVIRPDGIDAVLGGDDLIAVDALGRTGVYGELDDRFFEIFGSSILLSTITVGFAIAADQLSGNNNGTTTSTTTPSVTGAGSTTTTSSTSAAQQGISQAVTNLGNQLGTEAQNFINTKPRITIDQGTRIKIFVNKDIVFPPSYFFTGLTKNGTEVIN